VSCSRSRLQTPTGGGQLAWCDASHSSLLVGQRAHPPTHQRTGTSLTESY
jgi:hypothetical protein